ncbi:hypothetical protein ACWCXX_31575 [Streptomyces sp. NPDC001732]
MVAPQALCARAHDPQDVAEARIALLDLLTDPDRLRGHLREAPTTEAKLRAAYALHRLTGEIRVTGLCVSHFGGRRPLDIGTLLFYWQD